MPDPIQQAQNGRPAGAQALTPDQIAAAVAAAQPAAPATVYQPAPAAQAAPVYVPPAAGTTQAAFQVGAVDTNGQSPEMMAAENARLKTQMAKSAVYNAAGGEEKFAAMSAWASTGRTPAQNAELNSALNNPNVPENLRVMAVNQAMNEYNVATGQGGAATLVTGDAGVMPGNAHGVQIAVEGIGEGEFQGRYLALRKAGKDSYSPEMIELDKQRLAGIGKRM